MGKQKTLFITAFNPFISRNIFYTGVLDELLKDEMLRVVVIVPTTKQAYYQDTFTHERVLVEGVDMFQNISVFERFFAAIAGLLLDTKIKYFHKWQRFIEQGGHVRWYAERFFTKIIGNSVLARKVFRATEIHVHKTHVFSELFKKYAPYRVCASDVYTPIDTALLREAKQHGGIETIGMVRSWDNNVSKTFMRVVADRTVVQNHILKDEVIQLHLVPEDDVVVTGTGHYTYFKEYQPISRAEFCNRMNIDPGKKIVLVSPAGDKFVKTDWQNLEILKQSQIEGKIGKDVHFLVRLHPMNLTNLESFEPNEHFTIEIPGKGFEGMRAKDNELGLEDLHHLIDTIVHADVVVNTLSSLVLDACVLETPVVTIGFDGFEKKVHKVYSVSRFHEEENMAKLLRVGGTPVVYTGDALIREINRYLENPKLDKENRQRVLDTQCGELTHNTILRVAHSISDPL